MADWLELRGVHLVVLAGYMHLLTATFLDRFPDRVVNVHPSLLPEFPGTSAIKDALATGVPTTGVTVHYVDEGVDSGPIIRQESVSVEPRETLVEADPCRRAQDPAGGSEGIVRALISVYDKSGLKGSPAA